MSGRRRRGSRRVFTFRPGQRMALLGLRTPGRFIHGSDIERDFTEPVAAADAAHSLGIDRRPLPRAVIGADGYHAYDAIVDSALAACGLPYDQVPDRPLPDLTARELALDLWLRRMRELAAMVKGAEA